MKNKYFTLKLLALLILYSHFSVFAAPVKSSPTPSPLKIAKPSGSPTASPTVAELKAAEEAAKAVENTDLGEKAYLDITKNIKDQLNEALKENPNDTDSFNAMMRASDLASALSSKKNELARDGITPERMEAAIWTREYLAANNKVSKFEETSFGEVFEQVLSGVNLKGFRTSALAKQLALDIANAKKQGSFLKELDKPILKIASAPAISSSSKTTTQKKVAMASSSQSSAAATSAASGTSTSGASASSTASRQLVARVLNAGPNVWIETGNSPSGSMYFQRGLSGASSAAGVAFGGTTQGGSEFLNLLDGRSDPYWRSVTGFSEAADSAKYMQNVNNWYAFPFAVKGKVDRNSARVGRGAWWPVLGLIYPYYRTLKNLSLADISHVGVFSNSDHTIKASQSYVDFVNQQLSEGFQFEANSRGAQYFTAVQSTLAQAKTFLGFTINKFQIRSALRQLNKEYSTAANDQALVDVSASETDLDVDELTSKTEQLVDNIALNDNNPLHAGAAQALENQFPGWQNKTPAGRIKLVQNLVDGSPPSAVAQARVVVTKNELSELAAATTEKVPEIAGARTVAAESNLRVAIYGGTSREVIRFVLDKVNSLGSVEAYRTWLEQQSRVNFLDWHRVASDLDIMVLPNEGGGELSVERINEIHKTVQKIKDQFPGNQFFKDLDLRLRQQFFKTYGPGDEHYEAISNIIISESGIEKIPELEVTRNNGARVNLTDWGVDQLLSGVLEFERSPTAHVDGGKALKQVLRWLRYISENPDMAVSADSRSQIELSLRQDALNRREQALEMLRAGDADTDSDGKKLIEALEKLQLYSRDSVATIQLLADYGIAELIRDAGIAERRIFEPLGNRPAGTQLDSSKRLGSEITVKHRTSLHAAQNISSGALWLSNNKSIIGDKVTVAAFGAGLYTASEWGELSYGDFFINVTLSADAVEGVDFIREGNYFILRTREAIAKNSNGSFKIEKVDSVSIRRNFLMNIQAAQRGELTIADFELKSLFRGIASILRPDRYPDDLADWNIVTRAARAKGQLSDLLGAYLQDADRLISIINGTDAFSESMRANIKDLDSVFHLVNMVGRKLNPLSSAEDYQNWQKVFNFFPSQDLRNTLFAGYLSEGQRVVDVLRSNSPFALECVRQMNSGVYSAYREALIIDPSIAELPVVINGIGNAENDRIFRGIYEAAISNSDVNPQVHQKLFVLMRDRLNSAQAVALADSIGGWTALKNPEMAQLFVSKGGREAFQKIINNLNGWSYSRSSQGDKQLLREVLMQCLRAIDPAQLRQIELGSNLSYLVPEIYQALQMDSLTAGKWLLGLTDSGTDIGFGLTFSPSEPSNWLEYIYGPRLQAAGIQSASFNLTPPTANDLQNIQKATELINSSDRLLSGQKRLLKRGLEELKTGLSDYERLFLKEFSRLDDANFWFSGSDSPQRIIFGGADGFLSSFYPDALTSRRSWNRFAAVGIQSEFYEFQRERPQGRKSSRSSDLLIWEVDFLMARQNGMPQGDALIEGLRLTEADMGPINFLSSETAALMSPYQKIEFLDRLTYLNVNSSDKEVLESLARAIIRNNSESIQSATRSAANNPGRSQGTLDAPSSGEQRLRLGITTAQAALILAGGAIATDQQFTARASGYNDNSSVLYVDVNVQRSKLSVDPSCQGCFHINLSDLKSSLSLGNYSLTFNSDNPNIARELSTLSRQHGWNLTDASIQNSLTHSIDVVDPARLTPGDILTRRLNPNPVPGPGKTIVHISMTGEEYLAFVKRSSANGAGGVIPADYWSATSMASGASVAGPVTIQIEVPTANLTEVQSGKGLIPIADIQAAFNSHKLIGFQFTFSPDNALGAAVSYRDLAMANNRVPSSGDADYHLYEAVTEILSRPLTATPFIEVSPDSVMRDAMTWTFQEHAGSVVRQFPSGTTTSPEMNGVINRPLANGSTETVRINGVTSTDALAWMKAGSTITYVAPSSSTTGQALMDFSNRNGVFAETPERSYFLAADPMASWSYTGAHLNNRLGTQGGLNTSGLLVMSVDTTPSLSFSEGGPVVIATRAVDTPALVANNAPATGWTALENRFQNWQSGVTSRAGKLTLKGIGSAVFIVDLIGQDILEGGALKALDSLDRDPTGARMWSDFGRGAELAVEEIITDRGPSILGTLYGFGAFNSLAPRLAGPVGLIMGAHGLLSVATEISTSFYGKDQKWLSQANVYDVNGQLNLAASENQRRATQEFLEWQNADLNWFTRGELKAGQLYEPVAEKIGTTLQPVLKPLGDNYDSFKVDAVGFGEFMGENLRRIKNGTFDVAQALRVWEGLGKKAEFEAAQNSENNILGIILAENAKMKELNGNLELEFEPDRFKNGIPGFKTISEQLDKNIAAKVERWKAEQAASDAEINPLNLPKIDSPEWRNNLVRAAAIEKQKSAEAMALVNAAVKLVDEFMTQSEDNKLILMGPVSGKYLPFMSYDKERFDRVTETLFPLSAPSADPLDTPLLAENFQFSLDTFSKYYEDNILHTESGSAGANINFTVALAVENTSYTKVMGTTPATPAELGSSFDIYNPTIWSVSLNQYTGGKGGFFQTTASLDWMTDLWNTSDTQQNFTSVSYDLYKPYDPSELVSNNRPRSAQDDLDFFVAAQSAFGSAAQSGIYGVSRDTQIFSSSAFNDCLFKAGVTCKCEGGYMRNQYGTSVGTCSAEDSHNANYYNGGVIGRVNDTCKTSSGAGWGCSCNRNSDCNYSTSCISGKCDYKASENSRCDDSDDCSSSSDECVGGYCKNRYGGSQCYSDISCSFGQKCVNSKCCNTYSGAGCY